MANERTGILGEKLGMTQVFDENNRIVPVTVVKAGPCVVTQLRTTEKDGYEAVQLAYGQIDPRKVNTKVTGGDASGSGVKLEIEAAKGGKNESLDADVVLVAIGRRPYTEGLGLENVGIELDEQVISLLVGRTVAVAEQRVEVIPRAHDVRAEVLRAPPGVAHRGVAAVLGLDLRADADLHAASRIAASGRPPRRYAPAGGAKALSMSMNCACE